MAREAGPTASSSEDGWTTTEVGAHLRGRRTSNTKPEITLRRTLHALGLRYCLNRQIGRYRPDIVFPRRRIAVFVDGCYWHNCPEHGPKQFSGPNAERWRAKLRTNVTRDLTANKLLIATGWRVVRVWECEIKADPNGPAQKIAALLNG